MAILVGDIGGTHCRFALFEKGELTRHTTSPNEEITDLAATIDELIDGERVTRGAFSVAGPLTHNKGRRRIVQNNGHLVVDEEQLERRSRLKSVRVLNDFEALAHATPHLSPRDLRTLKQGESKGDSVLVGPGTGLGQALIIDGKPVMSEGHHTDIPLFGKEEYALAAFTNEEMGQPQGSPVWHEELLSGRGLERLYRFLRFTKHKEEQLPSKLSAEEIGQTRKENPCSAAAFKLFERLLARRCRNLALEAKALGGVYLAGGVVTRNLEAWGDSFVEEFTTHDHPQWAEMLAGMGVRIITDERAFLLGAGHAMERGR